MAKQLTTQPEQDPHAETKAIVERLLTAGQRIDIDLPSTLVEQQQWALNEYENHIKAGLKLGYALVVIKQQLEHGEFTAWLKSVGINDSTARKNMQVATFLASFDSKRERVPVLENPHLDPDLEEQQEIDAVLAKIIKLPLRKQLVLAQETPERVRHWIQTDFFDELEKMSLSDLRTVIKQQKEIEKLEAKASRESNQLFIARQQLQELKEIPKEHIHMEVFRKQILQDTEMVNAALQRLRKMFETVKHFQAEHVEDAKQMMGYLAIHQADYVAGSAMEIGRLYRELWNVNPLLPMSMPRLEELHEDELFAMTEAIKNQQAFDRALESSLKHALNGTDKKIAENLQRDIKKLNKGKK